MYRVANFCDTALQRRINFVYLFPRETWAEAVQTMILEEADVSKAFKIGNGKVFFGPNKNWRYEEV